MIELICWKYYPYIKLKYQNYYLSTHVMLNISIRQLNLTQHFIRAMEFIKDS